MTSPQAAPVGNAETPGCRQPPGHLSRRATWLLLFALSVAWVASGVAIVAAAQAIFSQAPPRAELITRDAAGAIFGRLLLGWSAVAAVAAVVIPMLAAWLVERDRRERRPRWPGWLLLASALALPACHGWAWQAAHAGSALAAEIRTTAAGKANTVDLPALKAELAVLHARSRRLGSAAWIAAAALAVLSGLALLRRPVGAEPPSNPADSRLPASGPATSVAQT